jgi:hypothetical protein
MGQIKIDCNRITLAEWQALQDPKQTKEDENELVAKILGITVDEYKALGALDARKYEVRIIEIMRDPAAADEKN